MANYFTKLATTWQSSPAENALQRAERVLRDVEREFEDSDDNFEGDFQLAATEDGGVMLTAKHNESISPDAVAVLVAALQDEFEDTEPFLFSWACICDAPRLDQFGGGAAVVWRGRVVHVIDARTRAELWVAQNRDLQFEDQE